MPASNSTARPPDDLTRHVFADRDATLDRYFLLGRIVVGMCLAGYAAVGLVVGPTGSPAHLGAVASYVLANVGAYLIVSPRWPRRMRWGFVAVDVVFVLLVHHYMAFEPPTGPTVTLAGMLALLLFGYTLYGHPQLTGAQALGSMIAAGAVLWIEANASFAVANYEALVREHELRGTLVMGYLALASLVSVGVALAIQQQTRSYAKEMRRRIDASIRATVERSHRERMQQLDQMKADFIDVLSHELRTPLTPLTSALSLLKEDISTIKVPADVHEMIDVAGDATARLQRLVHDYVRLAETLTARGAETTATNLDLDVVIERLLPPNTSRRFAVGDLEGLSTYAAPPLLLGALTALLRRADLATPAASTIRIYGSHRETHVALFIHDPTSYVEVSEATLDDPFHPSAERIHHTSSTGLELVLANHSLQQLGGRMEVHSIPEEGTTVTCLLPPARPDAAPAEEDELSLQLAFACEMRKASTYSMTTS